MLTFQYFDTALYSYVLNCSYKTINNLTKTLVKENVLSYTSKVAKRGELCYQYRINYENLFNTLISDITDLKQYLLSATTPKHGKSNKVYGISKTDLERIFGVTIYAYMNRECIYNKNKNKYDKLYEKLIKEIKNIYEIGGNLYNNNRLPEHTVSRNKQVNKKSPAVFSLNLEHAKIGKRLGIYHIKSDINEIENYFDKKYKGYKETKILVNDWNNTHSDNKIQFKLTIKNNKKGYITSIGIRAYYEICGTVNDIEKKNHITKINKKPRSEFFKEHNFQCVQYFDVHSSIPNVLNWLRTGTWENIDWHTKIATENGIDRETAKLESMRCLFDRGTVQTLKKHCKNWLLKNCNTAELEKHYESINACFDIYGGNKYKSELFIMSPEKDTEI